jgi:hypothetical protein
MVRAIVIFGTRRSHKILILSPQISSDIEIISGMVPGERSDQWDTFGISTYSASETPLGESCGHQDSGGT